MRRSVLLLLTMLALLVQPLWTRAADVRVIAYQDAPLVIQHCDVEISALELTSGSHPVLRTTFTVAGAKDIDVARFRYQFFDAQGHVIADARPEQTGRFALAQSYTSSQPAVTPLPSYASVACAPAYAHFTDGTTWFAPNQSSNVAGVVPIILGAAAVAAGIAVAVSSHSSSPSSPPVPPPTAPPPPPSLTVSPTLLTFTSSTSSALTFGVSGGTKPYTIDSSKCSSFARVTGSSPGPYTVTPIASATTGGECTITVRSSNDERGDVGVVVKVPQLTVGALTFSGPAAPAQVLAITGGAAPFIIDASECRGTATVSPASGPGPFTVTPVASNGGGGSCDLTVTGANHATQRGPVTVAPTALTVSPAYFTFTSPSAPGQTLTAKGGRAPYTIDLGRCSLVTVTPSSGSSPFTVTPDGKGVGSCVIVLRSADHQTQSISIDIGATPLSVTPSSITFTSPTSPAQTFTASGAVAPYKATAVACTTVATLSGTSPTFTLTPLSSSPGGTCVVKVTSTDHQEATVIASVSVGTTLSVTPVALTFANPNAPAQTFAVSGGTPPYTVTSPDCTHVVTFSPATLSSAGSVTVTAAGTGSCGITVEDSSAVKQSRSVAIVVGAPAFSVEPATLEFATPQASAQDVTVSGGVAPYTMDDSACASVATISGTPSSGTLTVTPVAVGTCVFSVRSADGSSGAVGVTVKAAPLTVTPGTLTFVNPYPSPLPQTISVTGGAVPYTVDTSGCAGLVQSATRRRSSGSPPSAMYTVTPGFNVYGTCALIVRSTDNQSVAVIVKLGATTLVAQSSLMMNASGSVFFALGGGGYPRTLDTSGCTGYVASVLKYSESASETAWFMTATETLGTCALVVESADGQYAVIALTVTPSRILPVTAVPSELRFADHDALAEKFGVFGGERPYTVDDKDCKDVVHVTGGSRGLYTVTPEHSSNGKTCFIIIRSANGDKAVVHVEVGRNGLEVKPFETMGLHALNFASPIAPPQTVRFSGATAYRLDASACAGVVTVGGSGGVYTVTPVRDAVGATCAFTAQADAVVQTVSVTVAPPLSVNPRALEFASIHAAPARVRITGAQPVSFVVSPTCAASLEVTRGVVEGFVQEFLVRPVREPSGSPCTITFTGNGQVVPLTVNVRTRPRH